MDISAPPEASPFRNEQDPARGISSFICQRMCRFLASILVLGTSLIFSSRIFASQTLPFIVKNSSFRTNLGINNLETTQADVAISLFDNNGTKVASGTVSVTALGFYHINDVISYLFGYPYNSPFEGYLNIECVRRIAAFASQIDNQSNDPGFIQSTRTTSDHMLVPWTTSIAPQKTSVSIVNLGDQAALVKLTLLDEGGALLGETQRGVDASSQWNTLDVHKEMGIGGKKGPLIVQSINGLPLALVCKINQTGSPISGFLSPVEFRKNARVFYLPYSRGKGSQKNFLALHNPGESEAMVTLRSFGPSGLQAGEHVVPILPQETVEVTEQDLLSTDPIPDYGLVRGVSSQPLTALAVNTHLVTGDSIYTTLISESSPELLIPTVTQVQPFSSSLMLMNLSGSKAPIQIRARDPHGDLAGSPYSITLPPYGTIKLESVLTFLSLGSGFYGPLEIRSALGFPIYAFSQVVSPVYTGRGALEAVDKRPLVQKKKGEALTIEWNYDPTHSPRIKEYRIYRAERASRNYVRISTVAATQKRFNLIAAEAGEFILVVKAYDGSVESQPSNEVILSVEPAL